MTGTLLAVPGALDTPTGGYAYARRLLAEAGAAGWPLTNLPLPGGFPFPNAEALAETARLLAAQPSGRSVIIDGLAFGVLPPDVLDRAKGPLIALCHHPLARETGLPEDTARRLEQSERTALQRADAVIATSEATARDLRENFGVPEVTVARPGTDPQPLPTPRNHDEPKVLAVGSLVPRKGFDTLVTALSANAALPWRCRIVGALDRDPAEAARIRSLIDRAGLAGRIELPGPLGEAALASEYRGADLFALPSRHEGFGMVFAEAIAHGLPVLAPDIPAVAEATAGGALLLPARDTAWADALARLLSDPAERQKLAARAREAASDLTRWPETFAIVRGTVEAVAVRA